MDMLLEHSLTADEAMDDMERFLMTFTIENGAAQSTDDGSFIRPPQLPSGQHSLDGEQEDEATEFWDRDSDDDEDDAQDEDDDEDAEFGYPTEETIQAGQQLHAVQVLDMLAQILEVDFETVLHLLLYGEEAYGDGGSLVVPASGAAVAGLEKQAFHAAPEGCGCECGCGITRCAICLEDFEDGEEVAVMPCSGGHEFHPGCITEWLGQNNTCPLCRHALPTDVDVGP